MNANISYPRQPQTDGQYLPLMEQFYTLQGEGYHQGRAAYFIRLAGCDVGCSWCDVKESWNADLYHAVSVSELAAAAAQMPAEIVVVTGGEPLLHPLNALCHALHKAGKRRHIETSGSSPFSGEWEWVCVSPKKFKHALPEVLIRANELKIIIYNNHDFIWAEQYAAQVKEHCLLYLQPEWSRAAQMLPLLTEYVKQHPKWRVSLQVHKYMNIP